LNNAKLNGILDRVYANQIQLQVSLLVTFISQLEQRTKDTELLEIISQYQSNLIVIEQSLKDYSNPSD
jgi:serine kinase of HPr protein (carbohydrate metabolism regulator)